MLKGLPQFTRFGLNDFLTGKDLAVTGCGPWKDYESGTLLGTKVEVVIVRDGTGYKAGKNGPISNLYEKLTIKVPRDVSIPIGSMVTVINGTATVYGDFRNQLSIKAEDVKVTGSAAQQGSGKNG